MSADLTSLWFSRFGGFVDGQGAETDRGAAPVGCPQPVIHAEVSPFAGIVDESGFGEAAGE